jgi:hypothetical protein
MTLVEVVMASVILGGAVLLTMLVLPFNRIQSRKAMDRDIMLDFMHHYIEIARAAPYSDIATSKPINALYDGSRDILLPAGGTARVRVQFPPSDGEWRTLYESNMLFFHPDLEWLRNRSPEYRVTIDTQSVSGSSRARRIRLETRWHPPLGRGNQWQTVDMETVVYPEFN